MEQQKADVWRFVAKPWLELQKTTDGEPAALYVDGPVRGSALSPL